MLEFQEQEGITLRSAIILQRLAEQLSTETTSATLIQGKTKKEWVGQNGLWKQKVSSSTMNGMWGRLKL